MRKTPLVLLFAGLAVVASPRWSSAQDVITAHVPFPFVVEGRVLPAGEYRVVRDESSGNHMLVIQSRDGRVRVPAFYEDPGSAPLQAPVTFQFKMVGERRYLSEITQPGGTYELLLPRGLATEAKLAKAGGEKSRKGND